MIQYLFGQGGGKQNVIVGFTPLFFQKAFLLVCNKQRSSMRLALWTVIYLSCWNSPRYTLVHCGNDCKVMEFIRPWWLKKLFTSYVAHFFEGAIAFGEIWMQLVSVRSMQQKATKIIGIYLKTHFKSNVKFNIFNLTCINTPRTCFMYKINTDLKGLNIRYSLRTFLFSRL